MKIRATLRSARLFGYMGPVPRNVGNASQLTWVKRNSANIWLSLIILAIPMLKIRLDKGMTTSETTHDITHSLNSTTKYTTVFASMNVAPKLSRKNLFLTRPSSAIKAEIVLTNLLFELCTNICVEVRLWEVSIMRPLNTLMMKTLWSG